MIRILSVYPSSPAEKAGISPGESIVSINGENVLDEIDYQALILHPHLEILLSDGNGKTRQVSIAKSSWESLGVQLDETIIMKPRSCRNRCVFCFIDQMPPGMRKSLYVKDDDWRLSLMMGNYVTLTNVDDDEFIRILKRKASPLYISVQATDPAVRISMLRNPNAGNILERLTILKNHGIQFHAQVVLCPGINDGEILDRTIRDLAGLWPAALSVAIVPVGMTRFRDHLVKIPPVDAEAAAKIIDRVSSFQESFLLKNGTRFVFLSDEFYCLAGRDIPDEEYYEDYPQIENGVGLIRQFEEECAAAYEDIAAKAAMLPHPGNTRILIPTGFSAMPAIEKLAGLYAPPWADVNVVPVDNRFFGNTITVTGLIVGEDLLRALENRYFDRVLISESMLRENSDMFLDNMTLDDVRKKVGKPVIVVKNTGDSFIRALHMMEDEND